MATLGVAGVEVVQEVLAETQSAILPLVPYLDTLRLVFIAVALGGIGVTIYAASTTGTGGGDDRRCSSPRRRTIDHAALRYRAIALAIILFLLSIRRTGERAGRLAERLETREKSHEVQR